MRTLVAVTILALFNFYVAYRLRGWWMLEGNADKALKVGYFLFFALQLLWPVLELHFRGPQLIAGSPLYTLLIQASFVALGIFSCLVFYVLLADALLLLPRFLSMLPPIEQYGRSIILIVLALTALNVAIGLSNAGKTEIVEVEMPIKDLPEAFSGFRIAHITDTHVGHFLARDFMQEVSEKVRALAPDMITMTGDVADGLTKNVEPLMQPLQEVTAPFGKFYVTGNHEYYWDAKGLIATMRTFGFEALLNAHTIVEKDGQQIVVAGIPDPTSIRMQAAEITDVEGTMKQISAQTTKILLSHQSNAADHASDLGFDAQLSGHTHGGQYFPYTYIIRFFQKYPKGSYKIAGMQLYVSKGTGFWGPPLRTGGKGEITLITLRRI